MTEMIEWKEEHPNCWFGYIKGKLFFKVYKWPDRDVWMLLDNLYYTKDKTLSDTPCLSKESAMSEAQDRVEMLREILTIKEK